METKISEKKKIFFAITFDHTCPGT